MAEKKKDLEKPKENKQVTKGMPVKRCPRCTVKSSANAKFCILCGFDLKDVPVSK